MKKDGFSLIELLVSVTLMSVVLVSLLSSLIKLRETYAVVNAVADVSIYTSAVARIINDDIIANDGIKTASCLDEEMEECTLLLGSGETRKIEVYKMDGPVKMNTNQNGENIGTIKTDKATIKYTNTTVNGAHKILYLKTLDYITKVSKNKDGEESVANEGYKFNGILAENYKYDNKHNANQEDIVTKLTIEVSDPEYNIIVFSAGSYEKD